MSHRINSHICLMLSVYKNFHHTVKYSCKWNHIFQGLTGLEIYISMKASKTKNRFEKSSGFLKEGINIPNHNTIYPFLTVLHRWLINCTWLGFRFQWFRVHFKTSLNNNSNTINVMIKESYQAFLVAEWIFQHSPLRRQLASHRIARILPTQNYYHNITLLKCTPWISRNMQTHTHTHIRHCLYTVKPLVLSGC